MTDAFADTYYFLALLGADPSQQQAAINATRGRRGALVTTSWVLCEVANFLHRARDRAGFVRLWNDLRADPGVRIVGPDRQLFEDGIAVYAARPDKDWSLTDCISFVVMRRDAIGEALTADHHFEQAGIVALLK
jgi:predicted nucleic acid-binding protein